MCCPTGFQGMRQWRALASAERLLAGTDGAGQRAPGWLRIGQRRPRLLQSGLNAGLWTVGLAACSPLCDRTSAQWQAMSPQEQDLARSKATLALFSLGVHSVIDHLEALDTCLVDIASAGARVKNPDTAALTRIMQIASR